MFDDWNGELYHHGILGMKWGVRRTPEELGHIRGSIDQAGRIASSSRNIVSSARAFGSKKDKRDLSSISDDELRKRINRLNMEKQYKDLTRKQTGRGFEIAESVLAITGSLAAITVSGIKIYEHMAGQGDGKKKYKMKKS